MHMQFKLSGTSKGGQAKYTATAKRGKATVYLTAYAPVKEGEEPKETVNIKLA